MQFLPGQHFDCSQCSKCCRGWRIGVDSATVPKIRQLRLVPEPLQQSEGRTFTSKRPDGSCALLTDENLCGAHQALGPDGKPWGCRLFPFRVCRTPDEVYVGVSFYCSAAQQNTGRPLQEHAESLAGLIEEFPVVGEEPMPVFRGVTIDWPTYRLLDEFLMRELETSSAETALGRALWAVAQLVGRRRSRLVANELATALEKSEPALRPPREPFVLMERYFFAKLLARCEASDASARAAFEAELNANSEVTFDRFAGYRGRMLTIEAAGRTPDDSELRRYLRALVFRKFLISKRTLLENLSMLYLVPALFGFWCGLSRLSRGAPALEAVDAFRALDECEYKVITHPAGLDQLYAAAAEGFVGQLDIVR